jgi:hypothetical protein
MAEGKIIGGPFSNEVISQLALRSRIVSKGSRSNEDLQYIAAKTGWVKLTSGVNVGGSSELAKKYIMIGGVKGRTGTDTYSNFTGENGKGFRPMPGITGVQINSLGQFGQLKEATVTFNCWDRSQITELELLFMRPGFTALLEWGHSIYATSDKEYVKTPQTIGSFFKAGTSKEQLYKEVEELKKQSGYNYDGMFGFIKNFSWSYRADGGYDCTTSLVSIGEIMESLTIDIDTPALTTVVGTDGGTGTIIPATMLQDVLKTIKGSTVGSVWTSIQTKFPEFASKHLLVGGRQGLNVAELNPITIKTGGETDSTAEQKFTFISLKSFCELVNTLIVVDNNQKNLIKLNTSILPIGGDNKKIPTCRFRTYKFHTSSDPGVCMLMTEGSKNWSYDETLVAALQSNKEGSTDEILNIYVNVSLLESAMISLLGKEKGDRNLLNLFAPIFTEINTALGDINDIGFQYEEEEYTYYIVDRKVQVETKDVHILNITGLKSTVSQFNFTTKLSPAITTMCAISAQAGATDVGLEAGALLRWNEGLEDRIITKKAMKVEAPGFPAPTFTVNALGIPVATSTIAPAPTPEQERIEQQKARRKTVNDALSQVYNSKQYDSQVIAAARTQYNQFSTNYVQFYAEDGENATNAGPAGIIPFQVGIEMDGISGMKIGQAFRINEGIMPAKYDGVVGFIVTGIDHSITGNRWVTNLKAQTIVLKGTVAKNSSPAYSDDFTKTGVAKKEKRGLGSVSKTLKEEYIPVLEKVVPNGSKGIKLLITAQTQMEGFTPGTKSYRTNNPGNIGNTDNGGTRNFSTLEDGIKGQYKYTQGVALNQNKNYKIGERKKAPAVYDKDSGQSYPGIDFKYNGTLNQYLQIYSTGARKYDTYLNLVVSYFAKNGHTITGETTLKQIYDIA